MPRLTASAIPNPLRLRVVEGMQRATSSLPRRLKSPLGVKPDFLVIGATKAGTTSLYEYLTEHPLVVPAHKKEVHFFDEHFDKGERWYRCHFPLRHIRAIEPRAVIGEATTRYLTDANAPKFAKAMLPEAKLVVLLRNPVDRAHSHHQMIYRLGLRNVHSDFAAYMRQSRPHWPSRGQPLSLEFPPRDALAESLTWIEFGLYAQHLSNWLEHFRRDQLLVVSSEAFFQSPQIVLDQVTRFLELDDHVWPGFPIHNGGSYNAMDPGIRRELVDYYRPHNQDLFELLGEEYEWDA